MRPHLFQIGPRHCHVIDLEVGAKKGGHEKKYHRAHYNGFPNLWFEFAAEVDRGALPVRRDEFEFPRKRD